MHTYNRRSSRGNDQKSRLPPVETSDVMTHLRRFIARLIVAALVPIALVAQSASLPNRPSSLKLAAIGDNGTGERPQYDAAEHGVQRKRYE